jgi:hypothetical protein
MERPQLRGAVRYHVVHLGRIQAGIASFRQSDRPPLAPTEFQRTCATPEDELLVDSCFDKSGGNAVGYENVDESVRLYLGTLGNGDGRGETQDPLKACPIGIPRSHSCLVGCVGGRSGIVARV